MKGDMGAAILWFWNRAPMRTMRVVLMRVKFSTISAVLKCHSYTSTVSKNTAGKYVRYFPVHVLFGRRQKCDVNANVNFVHLEIAKLKLYNKSINSRESENAAMIFFILMPKYRRVHASGESSGENINTDYFLDHYSRKQEQQTACQQLVSFQ
jgi:hypothetical protein